MLLDLVERLVFSTLISMKTLPAVMKVSLPEDGMLTVTRTFTVIRESL